jgi:hypothetical protein
MEYDYESELVYHRVFGFRVKIQDIFLLGLLLTIFLTVAFLDIVKYIAETVGSTSRTIEVYPIQEIPQFKTSMYQLRVENEKKGKKKPTVGKFADKVADEAYECITCGIRYQLSKRA